MKKMKFRNYVPQSEDLQMEVEEEVEKVKEQPEEQQFMVETPRERQTDIVEDYQKIDLNTLAPRKVDWDLKKRIEKKLDRLERRTKKAIDNYVQNKS